MTSPSSQPITPTCAGVDFSADSDIDLLDFAAFARTFKGP
jgi:hypothetical protein